MFRWDAWEAFVDGARFAEGRPRGDAQKIARDLQRLRALTESRPGLRVVIAGDDGTELTVENGRFGVHDVAVRRFLDDARDALPPSLERRAIGCLEVRAHLPSVDEARGAKLLAAIAHGFDAQVELVDGELRARLHEPTPTGADAFLRAAGAELYAAFALQPIAGRVLTDGEELGAFDDALALGDLGEAVRRRLG